MNKKKVLIIIAIIVVIIVIVGMICVGTTKATIKGKMEERLRARGIDVYSEVNDMVIKYSIKNSLIYSNEWTVAVEYYDEPNVYYMYNYKDKEISFAGISGGEIIKDKLEYKYYE